MGQRDASGVPRDGPFSLAGVEPGAVGGPRVATQVADQPGLGGRVGNRGPVTAQGHPGIERDGPPVAARQETGGWGSPDGDRDRLGPGRVSVHPRPESSGTAPPGRSPVGPLLADRLAPSAPGTRPTPGEYFRGPSRRGRKTRGKRPPLSIKGCLFMTP